MADQLLTNLWNSIVSGVKSKGDINPPLWRALDNAVPIILDGTTVVIGYDVPFQPDGRFLELPGNQAVMQTVLSTIATKPLQLLIIDGLTLEDYQHFKDRQAAAAEIAARPRETPRRAPVEDVGPFSGEAHRTDASGQRFLSELQRDLHMRYVESEHRGITLRKAMFLRSILPTLLQAEAEYRTMELRDELEARHWSRLLERVAEMADADPVTFCLIYLDHKEANGADES
ncbi:MAG TPA: hypothetical protein DCZ72_07155 [Armatimonadetes bacterium]|nr:hypothetical protein [Armatimonadota bacterium]